MALAALLGVSVLFAMGILNGEDITGAMKTSGGSLALLFSGMVVVHILSTMGLFERIGAVFLRVTNRLAREHCSAVHCHDVRRDPWR
jgi:Na+/H+ antiporter NhaD/arsenite permease-like protein